MDIASPVSSNKHLLSACWDPKQAAANILEGLINVCEPSVKGAHDADFVIVNDRAYIVYEANDIQPGENPTWPFIYCVMSIVNLNTNAVEKVIRFASSEMDFRNAKLPAGACFVPRIIQKNDKTLRCFFASENPGVRESQTWYIDFDLDENDFIYNIYKAKLKISLGTFDMQPRYLYMDAVSQGFKGIQFDYGMYIVDSFREFDNKVYAVLNNFKIGQNALAILNEDIDTFEVIGHYNEPYEMKLTESSINRLPDGSWLAISRQENGNLNYAFSCSKNGREWSAHEYRNPVYNGDNSKPNFDKFNSIYYLGWQDAERLDGIRRSIFNIDISTDCINWERKYRFETVKSFQYPKFLQYKGTIYLAVTQGDTSASRKERIMFGKLE
ncbi:MAG TPA: exo-alpha-sialidase [Clostridiaceae bacterium]|jgi:hypothetical protein|nr:exo-alpha-sialidase [Clostridiaceae bacterium]